MTILNIIERAKITFPQASHSELLKDIDTVQKRFSEKTLMLEKEGELASPSTSLEWSLPSDFLELSDRDSIELYDSNGNPLYLKNLQIWYTIDTGVITFYSTSGSTITSIPSSVDTVYMRYKYRSGTIDEVTDSLTIDEDFHEGIESGAMERLYVRYPTLPILTRGKEGDSGIAIGGMMRHDMNMIQYHRSIYDRATIDARKRRNSKRGTYSDVQSYPFAGRFELIKRGKLSGATTILPVSLGYDNYLKVTCTSPTTVTIGTSWGWTTTPTGVISSGTLTLTSASSEFTETMMVQSPYSMRHSRSSATTWVFTLPSSYTNCVIYLTEPS